MTSTPLRRESRCTDQTPGLRIGCSTPCVDQERRHCPISGAYERTHEKTHGLSRERTSAVRRSTGESTRRPGLELLPSTWSALATVFGRATAVRLPLRGHPLMTAGGLFS